MRTWIWRKRILPFPFLLLFLVDYWQPYHGCSFINWFNLIIYISYLGTSPFLLFLIFQFFQGGDDHLLDSPSCIRFLIKLLRPVAAPASTAKAPTIGSKLLAMRLDADVSHDSVKGTDSTSSSIIRKVQEVLVSCKEIKPNDGHDGHDRAELNPKWISLLTMAKACLSAISIEGLVGT